MFAVIKTGGKQYKVATNDIILVEKLEAEEGASVALNEVLMIGEGGNITVGTPVVKGATVTAKVVEQRKGDKVIIFKKNRRHNYRRKRGHRQFVTVLKIEGIKAA
jgi:large subunit ribosomal protein L21